MVKHLRILVFSSLLAISPAAFSQIVINEIQTSNYSTLTDEFYHNDDWIELYNAGSSPVNLLNYGLSDTTSKVKFHFPDYTLNPGQYLIVFASDSNQTILTHWETAVNASDTWKYKANTSAYSGSNWRDPAFNDASWSSGTGGVGFGDSDDGTTVSTCISVFMRKSFNIADTSALVEGVFNMDYDDGYVAYLNGVEIARRNLGVPGVIPSWNLAANVDYEALLYQNKYPDSIHFDTQALRSLLVQGTNVLTVETHNTSSSNTDLTSRPFLTFAVKNGSTYFSTPPSWFHKAVSTYFHANFKLSKSGETVVLTDASGNVIDLKATGYVETNTSITRNPDGSANWCIAETPTPGASNNSGNCASAYTTPPVFSLPAGFYSTTQSLTLSTSYPGGQIRYTTDGSDVTSASAIYSGPISISTTKVIRARVFAAGAVASPQVTNSYLIGFSCHLPVYSITTDPANLNDYNTGIFANGPGYTAANPHWGANYWLDMEKPISLEYFERDKSLAFRFNAGISVTGGWSRASSQKSVEINMGDKYGLADLNYSLESDKPWNDKWNDFILHTTGNDRTVAHMRDPLMCRLLHTTHVDYLAYEPCILLLNGQNWGVYYTRENDDHHFVETNYGYKSSEIDFLKESYFFPGIEVKKGSDSAFFAMYNYVMNTSPSDTGYFRTVGTMMDIENMVDYFIAETYYPNDDWMGGGNNNLKLWRPRKATGKFKYITYDLDFGLGLSGSVTNDLLATALNASPHNYNSDLFKTLIQNPAYKRYFINRYADLINTIFLPANVQSMANAFRDSIKYDMHLQFEKWGSDSSTWISAINSMVSFANSRPSNARNIIQNDLGMTGQVTLTLQVSPAGAGTIQISTINPATYPWSGVYFNGNPVTITAIPNPGFTFDHWKSNSVISSNDYHQSTTYNFTSTDAITCYFTGSAATANISVSEINFHSDTIHDSGDWIELHNRAGFAMDISNWKFRDEADNHTYQIPVGTVIPANGYLVLASDLTKFRSVNPTVTNVIGDFGFDFSNNSEMLRLFNRLDQLYTSVTYADYSPWPLQADGQGYTLERLDESALADDGSNWFAGCIGGSPGRAYSGPAVSISPLSSQSICTGSSVLLTAVGGVNYSYQWKKDNVDINGETTSSLNVNAAGTYSVSVSANGCSAVSDTMLITVLPLEQVLSVSDGSACGNGTVNLSATGTSTLNWYADNVTNTILATGNNFTTPVLTQSTDYYVQAGGQCPGQRVVVHAAINSVPSDPTANDVSRCGNGIVTLTGNSVAPIQWFDDAAGTNLVGTGNSFITPSLSQNTTYYLQANNGCTSGLVAVNAIINPVTADPVTTDAQRCGNGTVTLTATDTATIYWYDGSGNLLGNGISFTTPTLNATTVYYAEAGSQCPSNRISATATILTIPADPSVTNGLHCGAGTVVLNANSPEAINWFDVPSGGNSLATGNIFTTSFLTTSTTFYVEAGSVCLSNRVPVLAEIHSVSANPIAADVMRCGSGSVTLTATASDPVSWYDAAGGNLLATGNSYLTPSISVSSYYYVQAGSVCPSSFVAVQAIIHSISAAPQVNGGNVCGSGAMLLSALSTETLNWYDAPGGNLLQTGTTYQTPVLNNTTTFFVTAGDICPSAPVAVNATVFPLPNVWLGNDTVIETGDTLILSAGNFNSYAWSTGATSSSIPVFMAGNYSVFVTDANGCTANDDINVSIISGVNSINESNEVILFPNPAVSNTRVLLPNAGEWKISIVTQEGKVLLQRLTKDEWSVDLSLSALAGGVYTVVLENGKERLVKRLVVK